jgi:nitroimidazol reductase NimA-like FMN-containing flavoprotein (pyridoxamine 5'-phosphate oxidase superfamily)
MRRKDKEITDRAEMEDILSRDRVCVLGLVDAGKPYTVPLNYGYKDGCLYIHSALEGRKVDILRRNPDVSFCVYVDEELVQGDKACAWGTKYRSVMGTGRAELLESPEEKLDGLKVIVQHFGGPADSLDLERVAKVLIIKVRIGEMTGKRSGYTA